MIWDIIEESNFDKHFQNPNLTIEELLVDENILTEMQNLNPQLLQFFNKNQHQIITKLVLYSTIMPRQEEGYDRCHRLPYVSSQMLAINNQIFYNAFLPKDGKTTNHLTYLFSFLSSESANNQLLLGYFEKITGNLYKGRKLQFTRAVSMNLPLFSNHLDKETIGNILKNCVILLGQKQGILYDERKKIVSTLVSFLVNPNTENKQKHKQIRQVCSMALVQIIGRHKTFSSGDELLNYLLFSCGQLLLIYSEVDSNQICQFLIGVLNKSTQKIYNPELDKKINIFQIPASHKKLLQGYLPLRLHCCQKLLSAGPSKESTIRQQDKKIVNKVRKQVLDYLTLLAVTLQNGIDQFLADTQIYYNFAWQCMVNHPKNDILLTQIDKIFLYVIKNKVYTNLQQKFKIVDKICEIFRNEGEERVLRPHLFQIWNKLTHSVSQQIKNINKQWQQVCVSYEKLVPLHTRAVGLDYHRTTTKLVVDQQQASASAFQVNQNKQSNKQTEQNKRNPENQHENSTDPFQKNETEKAQKKEEFKTDISLKQSQNNQNDGFKQFTSEQKNEQNPKQQNPFGQFGDFFNNYQPKSEEVIEEEKKLSQKSDDFGAFDEFM